MKSAVGTSAMELLTQKTCSLHPGILVIDFFLAKSPGYFLFGERDGKRVCLFDRTNSEKTISDAYLVRPAQVLIRHKSNMHNH